MSTVHQVMHESDIAVIGMAGRFPGAPDLDSFWRNLRDGVESISFFTPEQLRLSGIPASLSDDPAYVAARAVLEGVELFEPGFFGFSPREASYMDPQHRLFLECAWEAMEDAGYDPFRYGGAVGVYAGASTNSYLMALLTHADLVAAVNDFQTIVGNDKDFLATRVSYHLNLRGPSVNVQTACSTSLVAVHMACQSLLTGECDMALAGGVSARIPQQSGYLHQRGGILSQDGHCRAFDAAASGTVGGNGAGAVLLKRLEQALTDGDRVRAVIKGSAANNDGAHKIGFTAPSVAGQAAVVAEALGVAGVEANDITYVEAHGTGTTLGDPIEIEALTEAFGSASAPRSCGIGSLKTNIGHLDAAAGIAGLIKTVLALQRRQLPPSLNFTSPNPKIRFQDGPFYVNRSLTPWDTDRLPRRAGVSSFGIGGTNAHVILEEAPSFPAAAATSRPQLLVLSARTSSALERAARNLSQHLAKHPDVDVADVAFTLQQGRKAFSHRRAVVAHDREQAARALDRGDGFVADIDGTERSVAFMFSGQGSQTRNMAGDLYVSEPGFRADIDDCARRLEPLLGTDIRTVLYPPTDRVAPGDRLTQTHYAQPALFVVQYALARLWMSWGVRPAAMIGHSLGEYVAACLAGVFSLPDALALVAARGRLMQELPPGAMVSVRLAEEDLRPLLDDALSIAAVNAPSLCVASGPEEAVAVLERRLQARDVEYRSLPVNRAFHSRLVETMLESFKTELQRVSFHPPQIPFVSNVSGDWISADEATSPGYWTDHLRRTVRFGAGVETISRDGQTILLEVAPAATLSTLTRLQLGPSRGPLVISSLLPAQEQRSAVDAMLSAAAKLWTQGVAIDWPALHGGEQRHRVPLPTYPFERRRCWIDARPLPAPDPTATLRTDPAGVSAHPRPLIAAAYQPPQSDVEHRLAEIWRELLAIERIGSKDNFFELGGHSLLLTRLVERLRETFEVHLPLEEVFQRSTIREQAELITRCLLESVEQLTDEEAQRLLQS